tara:strand:+ start:3268 stop:3426 length:159 start_codon:yes stop_codon:yes gene_type:complete
MGKKQKMFYDLNDKVNKAIYNKGYRAGFKAGKKIGAVGWFSCFKKYINWTRK